jgi:hypothetical protein
VIDENHRYPVLKTRLVDECLHPTFGKNFFLAKNFSRRSVVSIFLQKKSSRGEECPYQALNGWTVCRFHGARGGAPEGKRNGNYRHGARSRETIELLKLIKSLR